MDFDDLKRLARHGWGLVAATTLVGALLGLLGFMLSPSTYVSSARSAVVAGATEGRVEALYQVTQAIRVTMPQYTALAQSRVIGDRASHSSGVPQEHITGLDVTTTPDSTVLDWSMEGRDPREVQRALDASLKEFQETVQGQSPRSGGKPVITVQITNPASPAERSSLLSAPLAGVLGAALGFMGGLVVILLRDRGVVRPHETEDLQEILGAPVVSRISSDGTSQHLGWGYTAAHLTRRATAGKVALIGVDRGPGAGDTNAFQAALDRTSEPGRFQVVPAHLEADGLAQDAPHLSGAVVLVPGSVHHLDRLADRVRSIRTVSGGTTCVIVDDRAVGGRRRS